MSDLARRCAAKFARRRRTAACLVATCLVAAGCAQATSSISKGSGSGTTVPLPAGAVGSQRHAHRCTSAQLQASAQPPPASSSATAPIGLITLENTSAAACSLQGYLGISFPARGSQELRIDIVHDGLVGARGLEPGKAPATPAPVVLGSRGASRAWMGVRWRNWCGGSLADLGVGLVVAGGGVVQVPPQGLWPAAACTSSAQDVLEEGPVQSPPS